VGKNGMDAQMVRQMLAAMPKHVRDELENLRYKAETAGDLVSFSLIGPCPKCGNELTIDGDDASGGEKVGDSTVGVCPECETTWCLECEQTLDSWPCPHWPAWEAHCKANGIVQDEDTCMSTEYQVAYQAWLDAYTDSVAKSKQTRNSTLLRLWFWLAQGCSRRRHGK